MHKHRFRLEEANDVAETFIMAHKHKNTMHKILKMIKDTVCKTWTANLATLRALGVGNEPTTRKLFAGTQSIRPRQNTYHRK